MSTSSPPSLDSLGTDTGKPTQANQRSVAGASGAKPGSRSSKSNAASNSVTSQYVHLNGANGSSNSMSRSDSSMQVPARRSITVAIGQFHHGDIKSVQDNTRTIISFIERASKAGAQVVCFHETATTGYSAKCIREYGHSAMMECERAVAAACRTNSIACVLGTAHFSERHGTIHNTALVIDEKGRRVCRQSKLQLVPTDHWAVPGDELCTFRIADVECCAIICHDIRHPELARLCAIKGAQVMFYISWETSLDDKPISLDDEATLSIYRAQVQARAVENNIFIVHANAASCEKNRDLGSHGMSRVVSPSGHILAEASHDKEELLVQRLQLTESHRQHALESLRASYFLKDWFQSGVETIFEASIPPESPHISAHGLPGMIGSSSRGASPRSVSPRPIGRSRTSAFGRPGGISLSSSSSGVRSLTSRRRAVIPSSGRSPTHSPNLSAYKRRRLDTLPIDYSSDSSDGTARTASRTSGMIFFPSNSIT